MLSLALKVVGWRLLGYRQTNFEFEKEIWNTGLTWHGASFQLKILGKKFHVIIRQKKEIWNSVGNCLYSWFMWIMEES